MSSNNTDKIRELDELYEDGLFRLVMNDVAEKEGKILCEENERLKSDPENLPSQENVDRFAKRLDSYLKKAKKDQKSQSTSNRFSGVAVALLVLVIIFATMILTVQALRIQVLNFLISIEPNFTSLQLNVNSGDQDNGQWIVNWINTYVPMYIPEGYEVSSISYSDSARKIMYTKQEDNSSIIYIQYGSKNCVFIDTENSLFVEKVRINGQDGILSVKDSITSVVWTADAYLFIIQGQVSKDEAVKMAESVKFIKK